MSRYPLRRTEYCKTVGKTRVENIAEILEDLGFTVTIGETENDDVDIWVYKEGKLALVIEVTNWGRNVYMDFKRVKRIIENFSNPNYRNSGKLLIFSFRKNVENQINFFEGLDTDFLEIGFQTQPYYEFYAIQGLAGDMRPNNLTTKNFEKRKITAYLKEKGLL